MLEMQLHHVEKKWGESLDEFDDEYFNFDGEFDATIERKTHSSLIVSGPMVDVYIRELDSMMLSRLSRGEITGIQQTSTILIPWQVFVNIVKLIKGYGGNITAKLKKNKEKSITITLPTQSSAMKIWNVKRCGRSFVSKIKFSKTSTDYEYAGCSKVVLTQHTPLVFLYETKTPKVLITFYIQRYDKGDVAVDAALQSKLNLG